MNTQEIITHQIDTEFLRNNTNQSSSRNKMQENKGRSLQGEGFSTTQATRVTKVENNLIFGYIHLQPNMKLTLGDLKESANVFHVVSGLGFLMIDSKVKILSKGQTIHVNEQNKENELVNSYDEVLTLVWWEDVAEEDWFHNHMV